MPSTAEKPRLGLAGPPTPSKEPPTSSSLLYALLLRTGVTRGGHWRESIERASHSRSASYGHTPRTTGELDVAVSEVLRIEVRKMLPYRGVLVENTAGDTGLLFTFSSPSSTASSNGRGAQVGKKDGAPPVRQWRAALAKLTVYDDATKNTAPSLSASASTAASPLSPSTAIEATGAAQRKKLPASTIVVKKRPPRRIADAEAAAAAATTTTATTAAAKPPPSVPAVVAVSSKPSFIDEKNPTKGKPHFTVLASRQVPAAFTQLKALLDDFAAAIEQCRVALEEQRSGSLATWEVGKPEDEARELSTSEDTAIPYSHSRRKWLGLLRRGTNTVLVADVPPRSNSAQTVSEMVPPDSMADMLRADHASGANNSSINGYASLTGRSISIESPLEVGEKSTCRGMETVDLPRGIVTIAYAIANHLYTLFHPTITSSELEEEAAALENEARGDSLAHLSASLEQQQPLRRTRSGAIHDESRSASPASRTSHTASRLTWPRTSHKATAREVEMSAELAELKAATHTYIWDRITTLIGSISLNLPDGNEIAVAGATESKDGDHVAGTAEERKVQAYVQLPFLIWLYAASGLATDVVRASEEPKANTGATHTRSSPPLSTSSAAAPLTLSHLLPTVDTLARQLQRWQYERVQPTAETLLTANTFLAFTGVKMTDNPVMERLFPLQSCTTVHDVLVFSTLQPTASLTGHKGGDLVDLSTATTEAFKQQLATFSGTTTAALEAPVSIEGTGLGPRPYVASSGGCMTGGSPLRRVRGTFHASKTAPPSGVKTQLDHDHTANVSTVEMYLSWLRGKYEMAEREAEEASGDVPRPKGNACGQRVSTEASAVPDPAATSMSAHMCGKAEATHGDRGERSGATFMASSGSNSNRSSCTDSIQSRSADSCVTQQQRNTAFHLSSMLSSADLSPCLSRIERELHQARGALQFARKLGTLYATQDMNTLLPLLPVLSKDERKLPSLAKPHSTRLEGGSEVLRGSFDGWNMSGSPSTFVGNSSLSVPSGIRPLPPSMTSPLNVATSTVLSGGLPPLIVAPLPPSERRLNVSDMLSSCRAVSSASSAALFPSLSPPSMDRQSLMAHLHTCAATMLSLSDQFFVSSARALELAFSLCMVLLSHVVGEAVLRCERAAPEASSSRLAAVPNSETGEGLPSVVVMKNPPFFISTTGTAPGAGAGTPAATADTPTVTVKAVSGTLPKVQNTRPLSINLSQVFGFGKGHLRYQHFSMYVRETLISVALSALQHKDVVITQELLQYIALDTAISHHNAQAQEHQKLTFASTLTKGSRSQQRDSGAPAASATIYKTRKRAKAPERPAGRGIATLQNNSASFVNVWFSSFAQLVDTTKHLLKGDHNTPSSLENAVWHLAGLAQYFLLTRARGYDVYGGRCHLSAASQHVCVDDLSGMLALHSFNRENAMHGGAGGGGGEDGVGRSPLAGVAATDLVASPALRHYITSQLVEPAEKVLGVLVSFMESIAEALTADMDSGAAKERQQREGVMFADVMDEDDNVASAAGPAAESSDYLGSACDSLSQMSSDGGGGGGGCSSAANRSEAQEAQTCWMELAVHYFLEIVDVLLDVSLYLPEKPLIIYQLTVSASHLPSFTTDVMDAMVTTDFQSGISTTMKEDVTGDSPLERFQTFLSRYTSLIMQTAVTRFSVEGINTPAWMVTTHGSPMNTPATTGIGEELTGTGSAPAPRVYLSSLLASVAASLTPVGLEDIALSSAHPGGGQLSQQQQVQQPPLTSRSAGAPVSARAETSSGPVGVAIATPRSTMWWPKARFQRYRHLVRIIEHAQLLCLYLNTSTGDDATPPGSIMAFMERANDANGREASPCLRVSAVTALLNTSTGPCAQLLSVPYACPPLTVEANSYMANSMPNTSRDRQMFLSPLEQPQGRYYGPIPGRPSDRLVLSDRVLREVCGGLWLRVEVLQLLRFAAAPLDADNFASFVDMAAEASSRVREKSMQLHYKAVAAMRASAESVLPRSYASTYVRLLFLRYVQAFYADMQAFGSTEHAAGGSLVSGAGTFVSTTQDYTQTDRTEDATTTTATSPNRANSNSYRLPSAMHTDPNNDESTTRSVASPRARAPLTSPLQDLSRRLWTQYCYQLLWALRDLCWNSTEAHETANNLSIASVYGRLLQMIGGRQNRETHEGGFGEGSEEEDDDDDVADEPELNLGEADHATIITFDRPRAPYCTTEGGKPEGFVDFESASSASEGGGVGLFPTLQVPPLQNATIAPSAASRDGGGGNGGRTIASTSTYRNNSPPPPLPPQGTVTCAVNVGDLTTLQSLELRNHNERSSLNSSGGGYDAHRRGVFSPPATAPPPPPVLPQLALTGLKPPLYFASSGYTAAAQEDDCFKEQSKQRQRTGELEERQRNVASVSVMDANSYISEADEEEDNFVGEGLEDFELSSGSPKSLLPSGSFTTDQDYTNSSKPSRPGQYGTFLQAGEGESVNESVPKSLAFTIPKLSLSSLGPPLYFTSAGDTGVFAEVPTAGSPARPTHAPVVPALNFNAAEAAAKTEDASLRLAKHVDPHERPALGGKVVKSTAEKTKTASPPPVHPSITTRTVGGFALPKLSFGALGPPMYFTSSGDTGGFIEAQNAAPPPSPPPGTPVTVTVGGMALPRLSLGALGPPLYFTSSGDTGGFVEAHNKNNGNVNSSATNVVKGVLPEKTLTPGFSRSESQMSTNTACFRNDVAAHRAPPVASSPEGDNTPATGFATHHRDFSSLDDFEASSWNSSFSARAATHKDEDGDGGTGIRGAAGDSRHVGRESSLVSSAVPDSEAAPRLGRCKKPVRRNLRLSVAPVVPPVVAMELILSLCSIILQRGSGMIQYGYTVSSLTQKRVLPGVSASQRRWLNSGNNMAGSNVSGMFPSKPVFGGDHGDHWRYTPQHSPSSFHVIQALHNYLKDPRNTLVVDLLEEWMLNEYAAMERARMEQFEAEYGSQKREGYFRMLTLSSTMRNIMSSTDTVEATRYGSAMSKGRFVLLRLLLPRAITPLVIPTNERRIGAGGYGSVTSGTVHIIGSAGAVLPANWGCRGCRWRPTAADTRMGGGTARSASGSHSLGTKSPVTPERAMCNALEGLRAPWRVAVFRAAQAACHCDVAIKHLSLSAQGSESGNLPVCHAEVLAMYRLRGHPHIVPLLSFDNTKDEYVLVMPNYTLGSFREWRQKHYQLGYAVLSLPSEAKELRKGGPMLQRPLSSPALSTSLFATCARSLLQVLEAVVYMHEQDIRHGDIKCDNLLIDKADTNKDAKFGPTCLPLSVRLCDFGSCDTCDYDDIRNLKNDVMAGAARFMAGRWGVGRGTEAIQPPELMSAKRRYTLFHQIMTMPTSGTASTYPTASPLERTERVPHGSSVVTPSIDQIGRTRPAEGVEGDEQAVTERLRRAELSVDVWACGCLLYEMLTGRMLFGEARLGRLLVLAAADEEVVQEHPSAWRLTCSTTQRPTNTTVINTSLVTADEPPPLPPLSSSPSSTTRQALDEWERHDLESAVGTQVVDFMSSLLNLDPLQRPSAAEALCHWKEILINMGFEV